MTSPEQDIQEQGIQFPLVDGRRSTQATGKGVFADAVRFVDAESADRIESTSDWRKGYLPHVRRVVELGAVARKNSLRIATDGINSVHGRLSFERDGGAHPIDRALSLSGGRTLETAVVQGRGPRETELLVPYEGRVLRGDDLRRQLENWQAAGSIEPSTARAVGAVVEHPDWLDLSDRRIALLGAASEMGPLPLLAKWGADVVAVDLPRPHLWEHILEAALAGSGRLFVPVSKGASHDDLPTVAGVDLLAETPEIRSWLAGFEAPLAIGNFAYADGATFVRVAVAADALATDLVNAGKVDAYAYLASPTEVYPVTPEIVRGAQAKKRRGLLSGAAGAVSRRRLFAPSYGDSLRSNEGREWGIYDCLVPQQGPNYALSKSIQRWRAMLLRENGTTVSANVAPATRTKSVLKNRVLASAYAGAGSFGVEVFDPGTSRALMAALLVHDLRNSAAVSNPGTALEHPYDLFVDQAVHGGLWRMPHEPRTVLPLAVLRGMTRRKTAGG